MKRVILFAAPVALALILASVLRAESKEGQWAGKVACAKCTYKADTGATECAPAAKLADGKVVLLTGDAVKTLKFEKCQTYTIKGTLSEDGKCIAVTSLKLAGG